MSDIVVTLPRSFGLDTWADEGDLPGDPWSGNVYHFYLGGPVPRIQPGERVYICFAGKLRGYAPLVRIEPTYPGFALVRHGGAVAVMIDTPIPGFRGFKYRFWSYEDERAFPDWRTQ